MSLRESAKATVKVTLTDPDGKVLKVIYNFLPFILFSILYIPLYEIIIIYDIIYYGIFERAPKMNWKV